MRQAQQTLDNEGKPNEATGGDPHEGRENAPATESGPRHANHCEDEFLRADYWQKGERGEEEAKGKQKQEAGRRRGARKRGRKNKKPCTCNAIIYKSEGE